MKRLFFSLLTLVLCITASAQVEPENDGIYYLYNTESGQFLSRGSTYGTHGVVAPVGLPWKVSVADGKYTLRMYDINGTSGLGDDSYTDNGNPVAFTPAGTAEGYTLAYSEGYLMAPAKAGVIDVKGATASIWQFLTQEQYNNVLSSRASTQEAAVAQAAGISISTTLADAVGSYATVHYQDIHPEKTGWTVSSVFGRAGDVNQGTYGIEIYQGGGSLTKKYTGLVSGIYKVTVHAMKRVVGNARCYEMGQAGYPVSDAYLKANGNIIPVKAWYENCTSDAAPNGTGGVVDIIKTGGYTTEGYAYVGENGELELSAVSEAYWGAGWFVFNGVELTLYSKAIADVTNLVTNPSFEEGSLNGWTSTDGGAVANNGNMEKCNGNFFVEKWTGQWVKSTGDGTNLYDGTLIQELSNLPAGTYTLVAEAQYYQQGDASLVTGGFFLTANDSKVEITGKNSDGGKTYSVSATVGEDGKLTIGTKLESCTGNWACVDNFRLYCTSLVEEIKKAEELYAGYADAVNYTDLYDAIQVAKGVSVTTLDDVAAAVAALKEAEVAAAETNAARIAMYVDIPDGKYLITDANADSPQFLGAGNDWGVQATMIAHPEYVELTKLADGKYTIKTQYSNGGSSQYFNGKYMDGSATSFEILGQNVNDAFWVGNIALGGKPAARLANGTVSTDADDYEEDQIAWMIISVDVWEAMAEGATLDEPWDMTHKILDARLSRNNVNNDAWTKENVGPHGTNANKLYESWHKESFKMEQTIAGLPEGMYEIRCNAFYESDAEVLPYLYANGAKQTFAKKGDTSKYDDGVAAAHAAAAAFAAGEYEISVNVIVGEDGTLTLGVASDDNSSNWAIWDNFQLYYMGEAEIADYTRNTAEGKYGTICLPYTYEVTGARVLSIDGIENGVITLGEVTTPVAGVPYIYQATADEQTFTCVAGGIAQEPVATKYLVGVFKETPITSGYVLQTQNGKQNFYMVNSEITVPIFKCYMKAQESGVKALWLDGETDAIEAIEALTNGEAKIYDANGRQLQSLQKGVNIVNGVKVLLK